MAKKIGHDYNRDPYPWDESEKRAVHWSCCEMNLPKTFYICPICERERELDTGTYDEL
jgi:hypothetical protein